MGEDRAQVDPVDVLEEEPAVAATMKSHDVRRRQRSEGGALTAKQLGLDSVGAGKEAFDDDPAAGAVRERLVRQEQLSHAADGEPSPDGDTGDPGTCLRHLTTAPS